MGQIINQYLFFFIISMTHKSEDYKISAVKYYLNSKDNIENFMIGDLVIISGKNK
jgi:hypothetical protein